MQALNRLRAATADQPAALVDHFNESTRPLLAALRRYVRREMVFLRARGDLEGDFPTVDDMVDESLARAYRELQWRPQIPISKSWFYGIASAVLAEEVKQRRHKLGRLVSLEKPVSVKDTFGEEIDAAIYDFWQPETLLKLEDVMPDDDVPSPEEEVNREELRRVVAQLISELPNGWRQAVLLTHADDMPSADVARQLGIGEHELARWLQHADAFLKARLTELGFDPSATGRPAAKRSRPS
jgi:RNA polymerase sigma factor (sigma-70 family)